VVNPWARQMMISAYNTCVTDNFMTMQVFLGNRRALDQAEGQCGHLLDEAYYTAKSAGRSGAAMLEVLAKNQNQLERHLLAMFPETKGRR